MSAGQQKQRKSSRQPVPNPLYQQGISQLKNQNPVRSKRRQRNNDQEIASYEDDHNSHLLYQQSLNQRQKQNESKDQYLACRMPDGSHKKVKFVFEVKKEEKKKEKEVVYAPVKTPVPTNSKKPANLLNLFYQALGNANEQVQSQQNPMQKVPQPLQKQRIQPLKPKRSKLDQQDYIKRISIENKMMSINHSQLDQIKIPVDWDQQQQMKNEQVELQVQEMSKKLADCKAIKNISILMA